MKTAIVVAILIALFLFWSFGIILWVLKMVLPIAVGLAIGVVIIRMIKKKPQDTPVE